MYPNVGVCSLDVAKMPGLEAVLDVVYNPDKTELILRAEEAGVPVAVGGLEMLVAQAVYAAEYFLSRKFDDAAGEMRPHHCRTPPRYAQRGPHRNALQRKIHRGPCIGREARQKASSTSTRRSSRPTAAASPTSSPPRARTASVRRNPPRPPALPKRDDSCSPAAAASSSGARICGRCIRTASCSSSTGPWMR